MSNSNGMQDLDTIQSQFWQTTDWPSLDNWNDSTLHFQHYDNAIPRSLQQDLPSTEQSRNTGRGPFVGAFLLGAGNAGPID